MLTHPMRRMMPTAASSICSPDFDRPVICSSRETIMAPSLRSGKSFAITVWARLSSSSAREADTELFSRTMHEKLKSSDVVISPFDSANGFQISGRPSLIVIWNRSEIFGKRKSRGSTPTTSYGSPLSVILLPIICGSAANRRLQSSSFRMTSAIAPLLDPPPAEIHDPVGDARPASETGLPTRARRPIAPARRIP